MRKKKSHIEKLEKFRMRKRKEKSPRGEELKVFHLREEE